jgi:curli biogenesis system outer membrane secretion channel CsgG
LLNNNLGNTPAERQRNQNLINSNNQDYAGIDKSKGEDFVVTGTLTAAAIYAAIVGDGNREQSFLLF